MRLFSHPTRTSHTRPYSHSHYQSSTLLTLNTLLAIPLPHNTAFPIRHSLNTYPYPSSHWYCNRSPSCARLQLVRRTLMNTLPDDQISAIVHHCLCSPPFASPYFPHSFTNSSFLASQATALHLPRFVGQCQSASRFPDPLFEA